MPFRHRMHAVPSTITGTASNANLQPSSKMKLDKNLGWIPKEMNKFYNNVYESFYLERKGAYCAQKRTSRTTVACWQGGAGGATAPPPSWQFLGGAKMKRGRRILKVGGKKRILEKI